MIESQSSNSVSRGRLLSVIALLASLAIPISGIESGLPLVKRLLARDFAGRDAPSVELMERALAPARPLLKNEILIGFIADRNPLNGGRIDMMLFYMAQYVLAPVVIHIGWHEPLSLAFFDQRDALLDVVRKKDCKIAALLGPSWALLRKHSP